MADHRFGRLNKWEFVDRKFECLIQ
jgi:hypothetical protein